MRDARDAFRRTGYAGTSLSDLAEATGLGKGSLYNTFGDKEQLFQRTFEEYCDEADTVTDALFAEDAGLDAVLSYLRMVAKDTIADHEHVGCMITKTTSELAVSSPAVVDRASKTLHHAEDLMTRALTRAQQAGEIDSAERPRDLARLLLAITRGIDALGKTGYSARMLRSIEATAARLITG